VYKRQKVAMPSICSLRLMREPAIEQDSNTDLSATKPSNVILYTFLPCI